MKGKIFMEKKFVLTEETLTIGKRTLYRIKAIRDFGSVREGDLGGFVEKERNLSHKGDCWIYNDACVFDEAYIYDNARISGVAWVCDRACIYDDAHISGIARISGRARISDNAYVYDNVYVCEKASIYGNAHVYGEAYIYGDAHIFGNACIFGKAYIHDKAQVCDNAKVYDNAHIHESSYIGGNAIVFKNANICGNARVYGEARVGEQALVQFSQLDSDLKEDLKASLRCQCNLIPEDNKVIAYKIVHKDLSSLHDRNFIYKVGKTAICENPQEDNSSCSPGLHFSNLTYWDNKCTHCLKDLIYLKAEISLEDIITIQHGKIRCRKAKILNKIEIF
jgi:carbonic anhydrase/acetyltransferase-like protein (isoleucine patch superfamily)